MNERPQPLNPCRLLLGVLVLTGATAVLLAAASVEAQVDRQFYSEQEEAMLPRYCKFVASASLSGNRQAAEYKRWQAQLGEMFEHAHHWCRGLNWTNRALYTARNAVDRRRALQFSIAEISYVIRHAQRDYALLPEFLYRRGENLIRLGRSAEGTPDLLKAIEIKPDYWPPYASLSDYHKSIGDTAKAREWLEKALAFSPETKALQSRLAELNGAKGGPPSRTAQTPAEKPAKPAADEPPAAPPPAAAEPEPAAN